MARSSSTKAEALNSGPGAGFGAGAGAGAGAGFTAVREASDPPCDAATTARMTAARMARAPRIRGSFDFADSGATLIFAVDSGPEVLTMATRVDVPPLLPTWTSLRRSISASIWAGGRDVKRPRTQSSQETWAPTRKALP